MLKKFLIFLIYFWHNFLGKILAAVLGQPLNCRFYPSCSVYATEALQKLGILRGTKFAILRILRCRPGGGFGIDNLP